MRRPHARRPGNVTVHRLAVCVKLPGPSPRNTLIVLAVKFATAKSKMPSPLKPPTATAAAPLPSGGFDAVTKFNAEAPAASVAVPSNTFPFEASRNDTGPVGSDGPTPPTVAAGV